MKKIFIFFLFILVLFIPMTFVNNVENVSSYADIESDLNENIEEQINSLDFGNIDEIIENIGGETTFGESNFTDKIYEILSGEESNDFSSVWDYIKSIFFDNLLSLLPILATIVGIAILGGMVGNIKTNKTGSSMESIIHFIIYGLTLILLSTMIFKMVDITSDTLGNIKSQSEIVFPVLLTLLTTLGGSASVNAYQPVMSFFSSSIIEIFSNFVLPLFLISVVLTFINNISNSIKLNKLSNFINSSFKWVIGIVFTVFTAFVSIQGISVGAIDGLSIRTAKFTIKNTIPMIGSYVSDGLYLIIASSNLIKNAVGGAGLILILVSVISPIIQLVMFILALKLMAGIIEPLGDGKIANFVSGLSKTMSMLVVILIGVSFMYMILVGLVICSVNIV